MRFPSQAQKKTRKFRFQIEDIGIIFQRLPSQAQKKQRKSRFQIEDIGIIFQRFPSQAQKKGNPVFKQKILALFSRKAHKDTEIPFSNEAPITGPEKKHGKSVFKQKILALFSRGSITSPKKGKSRFQIEDIGIIFQKSPKRHGNPVFK